jgi:hypothetical protein
MAKFLVKLRYYVGDPLEEIKEGDLEKIKKQYGTDISYEKIEKREMKNGILMEDTMQGHIEDISQEVITVAGDKEKEFSDCILALYKKYRCPRTAYSLMGSNEAGRNISWGLMDVHGGWD